MNRKLFYFFIYLFFILSASVVRIHYLNTRVGVLTEPDFGGDPCHHYSIAKNIADGNGPKTSFILSYWFHHPDLPAVTDIYPPGSYYVMAAFMKAIQNDFFGARLASLVMSIASVLLLLVFAHYHGALLGGILGASFLIFNWTHFDHSVSAMTPVISSFFILLALFGFTLYVEGQLKAFSLGVLWGATHLFQSVGMLFLPMLVIRLFAKHGKDFWKQRDLYLAILGFILAILPWAIYTYSYFGKPLYSNLNFYPFVDSWDSMLFQDAPPKPNLEDITKLIDLLRSNYLAAIELGFNATIPVLQLSWIIGFTKFFSIVGILRLLTLSWGRYVILFSIMFVAILVIGSRALLGNLYPRHLIPIILLCLLLASFGFDFFMSLISRFVPKFIYRNKVAAILALIALFAYLRHYSRETMDVVNANGPSFWIRTSPSFAEASVWIKKHTEKTDRFIFALTPQDLSCWTDREVIVDPTSNGGQLGIEKAAKEIDFYKVKYLMLDFTKEVYPRPVEKFEQTQLKYPSYNLTKVFETEKSDIFIYKLDKK